MFAIVKTGGKQYRVMENKVIRVEKLDVEAGSVINLTEVLMISDGVDIKIGAPLLTDVTVQATVLDQIRDKKVIIFKKKRRHNYRRKNGHRQNLTILRITKISAN
ncbi:MAG: 50S ribosomal protein L21 [Alphaproteobacteria bacterium]|nr:50S ribosomal protein L21 [Alphaproteobacteria bacterium]